MTSNPSRYRSGIPETSANDRMAAMREIRTELASRLGVDTNRIIIFDQVRGGDPQSLLNISIEGTAFTVSIGRDFMKVLGIDKIEKYEVVMSVVRDTLRKYFGDEVAETVVFSGIPGSSNAGQTSGTVRQLRIDNSISMQMAESAREYASLFVEYSIERDVDALRRAEKIRADGEGVSSEVLFEAIAREAGCTVAQAQSLFSAMTRRLAAARSDYSKALRRRDTDEAVRIVNQFGLPEAYIDNALAEPLYDACMLAQNENTSLNGVQTLFALKKRFNIPDAKIAELINRYKLHAPYERLVQHGFPRIHGVSLGQGVESA